tara:strand:- start:70 stop:939 length:870 start_codon:yes stop_codon:yes gene_type:complete
MKETFGSGANVVKGLEKFYNVVDKSGLLKNNEKKNEQSNEQNNLEEVKTNLFKKATENKNKEESNEDVDKDSKIISYDFKGINPSKNIFNYNPQANVGFDLGKKGEGFFATGDIDASRRGVDTNFEAGFKNENVDIGFKPEKGITLDLQKQFGNNTNLNINQSGFNVGTKFGENTNVNVNQSGAQVNTKLGENTNVNLGYRDGDFNPSLTTEFKETNIAVNPDRFNLNRTFEIGDDTRINVGGEVDFDGESKGKIDFTKDFLNKKLQVYGGADTKGDFEVGTKFKFLNL